MTLLCRLLGHATGVRERRPHEGIPAVLGVVCARCDAWVPLVPRTPEERARLAREGRVRLSKARRQDSRVLPMRRTQ
jgi:hypothetical protein